MMTTINDLVNPTVMSDMIQEKMLDALRFAPLAKVDTSLQGRPGDTVVLPKYAYIGDAADVGEGEDIEIAPLTATSANIQVKKAAKGAEITDEAALSGYGDPMGELTAQLATAIAQKVDNDCLEVLRGIEGPMAHDAGAAPLSADVVADALEKFGEDLDGAKVLLVSAQQLSALRKDPEYRNGSEAATQMMMEGSAGSLWGCQIVVSNKIRAGGGQYENFIVKPGALAIFLKKDVTVEMDRNIRNKTTMLTADEHYAVYLYAPHKAIKLVTKE